MSGLLASDQLWWYTARSSGIVAWAMLSASVMWGLALSTRVLRGRPRPAWLLDLHRFLGAAAVVFTGVHLLSLVLDSYVSFGPSELLVPFASHYRPAAVAWGVVGFYLLLAIEVTSLLRRRLPRRVWRATHCVSFPLFVMATAHAVSAGTDAGAAVLRAGLLVATSVFALLVAVRVNQAEQRGDRRPRLQEAVR